MAFFVYLKGTFEPNYDLRRHFSEIFFCAVSIELHLNHVLVFLLEMIPSTLFGDISSPFLLFQLSIFFPVPCAELTKMGIHFFLMVFLFPLFKKYHFLSFSLMSSCVEILLLPQHCDHG